MRRAPRGKILAALAFVMVFAATAGDDKLVYRSPRDVTFEVTAEGLSAIRLGAREIAKGNWSAWNAEGWFKNGGTGKVKTKTVSQKSIEVLGADRARVRHVKDDIVCVFEYSFAGEDTTISARIENNNADFPMEIAGFSGLQFLFDALPAGQMPCQHVSYFQAHGIGLCHPGFWSKIGGSYATDNSVGIGTSPWKTGLTRTLTLWDYADWNPDKREKSPKRNLLYFVVSTVPARGAHTFDLKLRVSPERDWKHLLEPYREHFRQTFGEVKYKADSRWIATDYLNHSQSAVGPTNPYGFHGGHRRIDTPEGAKLFCDTTIAPLKEANGQGVIVWGQGGDDPRGGMYRPDFDVLPPEVEAQWPAIAQRFKDAGLKLGVCTRPCDMAVKLNWKSDQIIKINADDPEHREMLWRRFKTMMDKGCSLFYLDSFGASFEDVKLMRALREKLGPDVLTFCEHQCDAIMPYSGAYSETTLHADAKEPHYRVWSGVENWRIYEWLAPGSQLAARMYETKGKPPADMEPADKFFFRHRITPLVPSPDAKRVQVLKAQQAESLDANGRFK
jgi:hypothetical protein